jgi:ankyrin repeat protein
MQNAFAVGHFGNPLLEIIGRESSPEVQLFQAALTGNIPVFQFLLDAGIDPNFQDEHRKTLAMHILYNEKILEKGWPGVVLTLMDLLGKAKKFDPNLRDDMGNTILHMAINFRNEKVAKLLVGLPKMNVNARENFGNTAFHLLAKNFLTIESIIRSLMEREDLDLTTGNEKGMSARNLLENIKFKASLLLDNMDAKIKERGASSREENLRDAIMGEDFDGIQRLTKESADLNVNWQDQMGRTLLMYAITTGNFEVIQSVLLLPDINLSLADEAGKTALDYAKDNRNARIIDLLEKAM